LKVRFFLKYRWKSSSNPDTSALVFAGSFFSLGFFSPPSCRFCGLSIIFFLPILMLSRGGVSALLFRGGSCCAKQSALSDFSVFWMRPLFVKRSFLACYRANESPPRCGEEASFLGRALLIGVELASQSQGPTLESYYPFVVPECVLFWEDLLLTELWFRLGPRWRLELLLVQRKFQPQRRLSIVL